MHFLVIMQPMYYRPDLQMFHAVPAQRRLVLGLVASGALHLLWLGLAHPPAFPRLPPATAEPTSLTLTLAPPVPRSAAPAVAPPAPAAVPERVRRLPARPPQVPHAADRERAAPAPQPAAPADAVPEAAPRAVPAPETPPTAAAQATAPSGAGILAAARHDAAAIARDLNHAPGSKTEFRSRAQEELDRRFDAAHAAGGAWFRSARVEEITTAADGNRRVYRIVTPLGAFCRTYYGDGQRPMNTTCPR